MCEVAHITGSWYPSGFHGHFRSKSRNDFVIPYRENAKPSPPEKFLDRSKVRSTQHLFSRHDNRNSHSTGMGDLETHFNMGLGKKKPVASQHTKSTSPLLGWNSDTSYKTFQTSYNTTFKRKNYISTNHFHPRNESGEMLYKQRRSCSSAHVMSTNTEPIHSRKNPDLQRRFLDKYSQPPCLRSVPLLAWNDSANRGGINFKPCIGDSTKRILPRTDYGPVNTHTAITERNIITW